MSEGMRLVIFAFILLSFATGDQPKKEYQVAKWLDDGKGDWLENEEVVDDKFSRQRLKRFQTLNPEPDGPGRRRLFVRKAWRAVKKITVFKKNHHPEILGGGWELVRRVHNGYKWHPSTDQLRGTDQYGTFQDKHDASGTFSRKFSHIPFTQFLFASGDGKVWLVAEKSQVIGWYANLPRNIVADSRNGKPHASRWYRRHGAREDPWISLTDHSNAVQHGLIVYGANNYGGHQHGQLPHKHRGANVFIRKEKMKCGIIIVDSLCVREKHCCWKKETSRRALFVGFLKGTCSDNCDDSDNKAPQPGHVGPKGLYRQKYKGYWSDNKKFFTANKKDGARDITRKIDEPDEGSHYSREYKGFFCPVKTGQYKFKTISDDGSVVWIDGQKVVDNSGLHGARAKSGVYSVVKLRCVPFLMGFGEKGGGAVLKFWYAKPGIFSSWTMDLSEEFRPDHSVDPSTVRKITIETEKDVEMTLMMNEGYPQLKVTHGKFGGSWATMREGTKQFYDRNYKLSRVSPMLSGKKYFQGPCHSQKVMMDLTVPKDSTVWIIYSLGNPEARRNTIKTIPKGRHKHFPGLNTMKTESFGTTGFHLIELGPIKSSKVEAEEYYEENGCTLILSSTLMKTGKVRGAFDGFKYGEPKLNSEYKIGLHASELKKLGDQIRITTKSGYDEVLPQRIDKWSGFGIICDSCNCQGKQISSQGLWWQGGLVNICHGSTHFGVTTVKAGGSFHNKCGQPSWYGHFHRAGVNSGVYQFGSQCINEHEGKEHYNYWICDEGGMDTYHDDIMGGGWKLVRRVKPGDAWHPANDHLRGSATYGKFVNDPKHGSTFSKRFEAMDYDQFLFATGDGKKWLVMDRGELLDKHYSNQPRKMLKSSEKRKLSKARMYNRRGQKGDPWVSIVDHSKALKTQMVLYGEGGLKYASAILKTHGGANVFVRADPGMYHPGILGGGWKLVRRVKRGNSWHKSTDQLKGTAEYGSFVNDPKSDTTFSRKFSKSYYDQFLFATGDGKVWLVADKDAVMGHYANEPREIVADSEDQNPHKAKWYKRKNNAEDPWISLIDHAQAAKSQLIIYGEGGTRLYPQLLQKHNGANVFIRRDPGDVWTFKIRIHDRVEMTLAASGGKPRLDVKLGDFPGSWKRLNNGALQFSDRKYKLSDIPKKVQRWRYFKGPCVTQGVEMTVTVTGDAVLLLSTANKNENVYRIWVEPGLMEEKLFPNMKTDSFKGKKGFHAIFIRNRISNGYSGTQDTKKSGVEVGSIMSGASIADDYPIESRVAALATCMLLFLVLPCLKNWKQKREPHEEYLLGENS